jgi:hypothetical protein
MGNIMSTIINATTTNGVVIQPDNSGSLVLQTNSGTTALTIDTSQRAAFVAGTAALPAITTTGDTNTGMFFPAADTIAFAEGGAEAMRLDSSGGVLVGTTTNTPGYKLYVKGGDGNQVILDNAGSTYTTMNYYNNGANKLTLFWDNSTPRYYVVPAAGGGVYLAAGATSWTASSDERVKDIIEPITDAANKVSTLRAVIGKYKTDEEGTRRTFLIAQDVKAVLPEAVDTTNTNEYGLRYTDTIPLLVAAIKELKERIETLEAN